MTKSRRRGSTRNQLAMPGLAGAEQPPEWDTVENAIDRSNEREPDLWAAFVGCSAIEVFTDGSAPVRNPGGPAGCSAVLLGYKEAVNHFASRQSEPSARLDLGAHISERQSEPPTSNNRAEIAGIAMAMEALCRLGEMGCAPEQIMIWSDSTYAIHCLEGKWKRKKNTDLWPLVDLLAEDLRDALPCQWAVKWVKGHEGHRYNESADQLATLAAFNFDEAVYARFRKAQAESGTEMPTPQAMARHGVQGMETSVAAVTAAALEHTDTAEWATGTDYTLVIFAHLDGGGLPSVVRGPCEGRFRLWASDGRSREARLSHPGELGIDEAEYMTLIWALTDLAGRISATGRSPGEFTLVVYSRRELLVKQLTGDYKVKSPALQGLHAEARHLLGQFKTSDVVWKLGNSIARLLG